MMRLRNWFLASLLVFLSVVNALVEDSTISQPYDAGALPVFSQIAFQRREAEKDCGFQGNSDLYGLGVRIGIYLQPYGFQYLYSWYFSGAVSQIFELPQEASYASLAFAFALLVSVISLTIQHVAYLVEPIIFFYLFIGAPLCSLSEYCYISTRIWGRLQVDLHFYLRAIAGWFISIMMWVYMVWFWIRGKGSGMFYETPCGTVVFLYARVPPERFEAIRIMFTIGSFAFLTLLASFVPYGYRQIKQTLNARNRAVTTISKTSSARQRARGKYSWGYILNMTACILGFVSSIMGTELILHWNKVEDVYFANTTGQLIPLILGICGAIRVVYLVAKKLCLSKVNVTEPLSMQIKLNERHGEAKTIACEVPSDVTSADALKQQGYCVGAVVAPEQPSDRHEGHGHQYHRAETV